MTVCSFCNEQESEGFWKSYCVDCAMLRRMLVLHNPKECVEILKRCLIRNEEQITYKIKTELKNQDMIKSVGDESHEDKPKVLKSNKKI